MELQEILYCQGFGTRRVCAGLVQQGWVTVYENGQTTGEKCQDAFQEFKTEGLELDVQGKRWPFHAKAYIMLNKPMNVECSQKPSVYPSIYSLLPPPLRQRPQKGAVDGVQAVGRLDQDTTGNSQTRTTVIAAARATGMHRGLQRPPAHAPHGDVVVACIRTLQRTALRPLERV